MLCGGSNSVHPRYMNEVQLVDITWDSRMKRSAYVAKTFQIQFGFLCIRVIQAEITVGLSKMGA